MLPAISVLHNLQFKLSLSESKGIESLWEILQSNSSVYLKNTSMASETWFSQEGCCVHPNLLLMAVKLAV